MFKGYETLKEEYCTRRSCKNYKCKRNQSNVKSTQTGVEYTIIAFQKTKECEGYIQEG